MTELVSGRIDSAGRLVDADPRLVALQLQAGGAADGLFAVPALAALARMARSLGVGIARTVIVAEGDHDLELLARVQPDTADDSVRIEVSQWQARPQRVPWLVPNPDPVTVNPAPPRPAESWSFETDARLIVTRFGMGGSELIGRKLTDVFRLLDDDAGDLPILLALGGGSTLDGQHAIRRDNPEEEVILSASVLRDVAGRFTGLSGEARAVASPTTVQTLPPADDALSAHIRTALRQPLVRIAAEADAISDQGDGPLRSDYQAYGRDIGSAARHLLALVDDLGDLQAVEHPDFKPEIEAIDLADLARRAAGLLAVRASDRGVRIDRPDADEVMMASGEFRRVLQILVNLIGNAVRYSPEGGMVWLRSESDGQTAVMIIADQGKGIALADQARIFEKFERVDPSEPGGSGLGLYISRRLARAMGGDIVVDSAPGQGARFVLSLPAG